MRFIFKTDYNQDVKLAKHGGHVFWYSALVVLLVAAPWLLTEYSLAQLNLVLIYAIAILGLNVLTGFNGQFSLGHGVFFAIGAYMTAQGVIRFGWSPWVTMLPIAMVAALVAMLISWPTFRLRGPFFAIATLAFNEVAFVLANHFDSFTGGPRGLMIPFKAGFANMIFRERWQYALLMFAFVALVVGVSVWLRRSRLGYYLLAVREDEDAARARARATQPQRIPPASG